MKGSDDAEEKRPSKPPKAPPVPLAPRTPDASVISRADAGRLRRAYDRLDDGGRLARPLTVALRDLEVLDRVALDATLGNPTLDEIGRLLEDVEPWPARLAANRAPGADSEPALRLRSPGAPLVAAFLTAGPEEDADARVGRAITAFLWRAEPVARVVHAARALDEGTLGLELFGAVARFATRMLAAPPSPRALVDALRDGPLPEPPRWPFGDPLPDFDLPQRPPLSAYLALENQAWLHCALNTRRLFPPLPSVPETSPPTGVVSPAVVCASAIPPFGLELTIRSSGAGFGVQGAWGIALDGRPAAVLDWTPTEIRVRVSNLSAGCNRLSYTYSTNWQPDDDGVGSACREALRIPIVDATVGANAILAAKSRFWMSPGSVSVLPASIDQFEASDGTSGVGIDACAPVTIQWAVSGFPCGGSGAITEVRLLRDGVQIAPPPPTLLGASLPPRGSIVETREGTATYRLHVTGRLPGGRTCGPVWRDLTVTRLPKALALTVPAEVLAGTPGTATLRSSCPAPAGGLTVALSSSPGGRLVHPPSVVVPAGASTTTFQVAAGGACGATTLTATAVGHTDATGATCVLLPPTITTFTPPADLTACAAKTMTLVVGCVGATVTATAVRADGARTPLRVTPPGAAGGCLRGATLTVTTPPLEPGTYVVEIGDRGGTATTAASFTITPAPRITSAPNGVAFNLQCAPSSIGVRVSAAGADAVEFAYTSPDGTDTATIPAPAGTGACATWTATFTRAFDRAGSIVVTPLFGAARGASRTIPLTVLASSSAWSAVTIDTTGLPLAPTESATITRWDKPCVGGPDVESMLGTIGYRTTRRFTLAARTLTRLRLTWGQDGGNQNETPELLGHPDGPELNWP